MSAYHFIIRVFNSEPLGKLATNYYSSLHTWSIWTIQCCWQHWDVAFKAPSAISNAAIVSKYFSWRCCIFKPIFWLKVYMPSPLDKNEYKLIQILHAYIIFITHLIHDTLIQTAVYKIKSVLEEWFCSHWHHFKASLCNFLELVLFAKPSAEPPHVWTHLIFLRAQWGRYHYTHFTDENTEAHSGSVAFSKSHSNNCCGCFLLAFSVPIETNFAKKENSTVGRT